MLHVPEEHSEDCEWIAALFAIGLWCKDTTSAFHNLRNDGYISDDDVARITTVLNDNFRP